MYGSMGRARKSGRANFSLEDWNQSRSNYLNWKLAEQSQWYEMNVHHLIMASQHLESFISKFKKRPRFLRNFITHLCLYMHMRIPNKWNERRERTETEMKSQSGEDQKKSKFKPRMHTWTIVRIIIIFWYSLKCL